MREEENTKTGKRQSVWIGCTLIYFLLHVFEIRFVNFAAFQMLEETLSNIPIRPIVFAAFGICALFFALSFLCLKRVKEREVALFILVATLPVFVPVLLFCSPIPELAFSLSFLITLIWPTIQFSRTVILLNRLKL